MLAQLLPLAAEGTKEAARTLDWVWWVAALPLAAAVINGLISIFVLRSTNEEELAEEGKRNLISLRAATAIISNSCVTAAWIIALFVAYDVWDHHGEAVQNNLYTWIPAGDFRINVGYYVDGLTAIMLIVVMTISVLVNIFSAAYLRLDEEGSGQRVQDGGYHRFFSYLPFFSFAMLVLVLTNNLLVLYVGWELVGLASFFLIGFWFAKQDDFGRMLPRNASMKAFIVNRVGDFGFGLGIMFVFITVLQHTAEKPADYDRLNYTSVFETFREGLSNGSIGQTTLVLCCLLLFMGAMGKSAQFPLNTWLPDAMAGPTPVSALIHAATMVTAGVYMVGRMNPLFSQSYGAMTVVAGIGAFTALLGGTIAITQKDIKAVMAYSTVSQLGYMFFALGVGGWAAAFFHLFTHAFFKACLFLGCGSVIHSMEEYHARTGQLHQLDPQDMDNMGNFRKYMPVTAYGMTAAAAALAGLPIITAGFWSKDEILGQAFARGTTDPWAFVVYGVGIFVALLTAFYSFRMIFSVFWGPEKFREILGKKGASEAVIADHPTDRPLPMRLPVAFLGVMSLIAGFVGLPVALNKTLGLPQLSIIETLLEPVFEEARGGLPNLRNSLPAELDSGLVIGLLALSGLIAIAGVAGAWVFYGHGNARAREWAARLGPLYDFSRRKWYQDEVYNLAFNQATIITANILWWFDRTIIDGAVNGVAFMTRLVGQGMRKLQTGFVTNYALIMGVGLVLVVGVFYGVYAIVK